MAPVAASSSAATSARGVSDVAAVYLTRRDISLSDLVELRIRVELALVDLTTTRLDASGEESCVPR